MSADAKHSASTLVRTSYIYDLRNRTLTTSLLTRIPKKSARRTIRRALFYCQTASNLSFAFSGAGGSAGSASGPGAAIFFGP